MPTILTGRELGERLGVPYDAVMSEYRAGLIPGIRLAGSGSGRVVFNLEKVVEVLRERASKGAPELASA